MYLYIFIYIYIISGNTNLMHLIKHLVHPGKYIAKHKSWDQPKKTAKLSE